MRRRFEDWSIEDLHKARPRISFPEFQRQANLWSYEKKSLLIDSILRDIDIPKLYFNETKDKTFEVVDGQQRLWAIWEFLDDVYPYRAAARRGDGKGQKFSDLTRLQKETIKGYRLQIIIFADADDDYLRELFVRLQLGLLLITGEKLHAASGAMKDFIFDKLAKHPFIKSLSIPDRRFAEETLAAQVAINSFNRAKLGTFARTRYEDLLYFIREYEHPQGKDLQFFKEATARIASVMTQLGKCLDEGAKQLRNRSYILSVYLFFEELAQNGPLPPKEQKTFAQFVLSLRKRLREEGSAGFDRKNRELYSFETLLSSAPGEKYQIERRHVKLGEYYSYFKDAGKIKGDK